LVKQFDQYKNTGFLKKTLEKGFLGHTNTWEKGDNAYISNKTGKQNYKEG